MYMHLCMCDSDGWNWFLCVACLISGILVMNKVKDTCCICEILHTDPVSIHIHRFFSKSSSPEPSEHTHTKPSHECVLNILCGFMLPFPLFNIFISVL